MVAKATFRAVHTAASLQRASVVGTTTADTKRWSLTSVPMNANGAHQNSLEAKPRSANADRIAFAIDTIFTAADGGDASACLSYAFPCIREFFGTPRSKNSIWSARILRLLRMNASYRFVLGR